MDRLWYVLHTRSRFENVVSEGLSKKSKEVFLPKIKVKSRRKDRNVMLMVPLFPGYVFVKSDLNPVEHLEILKTVGVVRFLALRSRPQPVPSENVESLKIMVSTDFSVLTGGSMVKGEKIIVVGGPFAGVIGVFERYGKEGRVVVNIETLGRFAAVEVNTEDIEPLKGIGA